MAVLESCAVPGSAEAGRGDTDECFTLVPGRLRMLTHADVKARDIDTALAAWRHAAADLIP